MNFHVKIIEKITNFVSKQEAIILVGVNFILFPIVFLDIFNIRYDDNGMMSNEFTLLLELGYGLQIAFLLGAYFFWKERKTEERKKAILNLEEHHWNAFIDERVVEYFDGLLEFTRKLEKKIQKDLLIKEHYYLEELYAQIGNRTNIEKPTIRTPLMQHVSDCRCTFFQGIYVNYPKIDDFDFKKTNLDLVRRSINEYRDKLTNFKH